MKKAWPPHRVWGFGFGVVLGIVGPFGYRVDCGTYNIWGYQNGTRILGTDHIEGV